MKSSQKTKGFTLVEIIAVLVIMAIAATAIIPTFNTYMRHMEQNSRNANAKTIFMAFQDVLTSQKSTGQYDPKHHGQVNVDSINPPLNDTEKNNNRDNIYYLVLNKNHGNKQNNELYKLLSSRIDAELLNNTILIEYNVKTGLALSAFYTDKADSLGYGGGAEYNVYNRATESLENKRVGYYGVESTSVFQDDPVFSDSIISIADYIGEEAGNNIHGGKNYGLLTVECILPANPQNYNYAITLHAQNGNNVPIYIKGKDAGTGEIDIDDISGVPNLLFAMENPFEIDIQGTKRKIPIYIDNTIPGKSILVLVIDSAYKDVDIRENFPEIENGSISASIDISFGSFNHRQTSNSHHAYYHSEQVAGGKSNYQIASIRHLKNLHSDKDYTQVKDIYCRTVDDLVIDTFGPACYGGEFKGSYTGKHQGKVYKIYDLTMTVKEKTDKNPDQLAGLFASTGRDARLSFIYLDYTDEYVKQFEEEKNEEKQKLYYINGKTVGGLVGINKGEIKNCTVTGRITGEISGGLVGVNDNGAINEAAVIANVYGEEVAGGVAGESIAGKLFHCEVGTASELKNGKPRVTGTPYFGANPDEYYNNPEHKKNHFKNSYKSTTQNNVFEITGTKAGAIIGGIVGKGHRESEINLCVNAAKIVSDNNAVAGGLLGDNQGDINTSYNAGDVQAKGTAGGIAGKTTSKIEHCYNTGAVNVRITKDGTKDKVEILNTNSVSGGIAGIASGNIQTVYNMQYAGAHEYSGSFGNVTNTSQIANCYVLLNKHNTSPKVNVGGSPQDFSQVTGIEQKDFKTHIMSDKFKPVDDTIFNYAYASLYYDDDSSTRPLKYNFHRTPWNNPENYQVPVAVPKAIIDVAARGDEIEVSTYFTGEGAIAVLTDESNITAMKVIITPDIKKRLLNVAASYEEFIDGKATPVPVNVGIDNINVYCVSLNKGDLYFDEGYTHRFIYLISWNKLYNPKAIQGIIYDWQDREQKNPMDTSDTIAHP